MQLPVANIYELETEKHNGSELMKGSERSSRKSIYLLVPTRWLGAISIVSVMDSWRTASPRSAIAHVPFFLTRIFLDLRSR